MARLHAGVKPVPHAQRQHLYRAQLEERGGKRLLCDLEADGAQALQHVMKRDGTTAKDSVSNALVHFAKLRRPR